MSAIAFISLYFGPSSCCFVEQEPEQVFGGARAFELKPLGSNTGLLAGVLVADGGVVDLFCAIKIHLSRWAPINLSVV